MLISNPARACFAHILSLYSHTQRVAVSPFSDVEYPMLAPPSQRARHDPDARTTQAQKMLAFRLRYSRAGSLVAALLVAAGSGLDHFAYPDRFEEFMGVRGAVALTLLGVFALLHTPLGARYVRAISMLWLMIPQLMIAWMVFTTEGAASPYFAGLLLALYAVGTVLPVTVLEGAFFGSATLLLYASACLGAREDWALEGLATASFFTHCLFILMSATTAVVCAWLNEKSRNRLHALKDEISSKNAELENINHTLVQIKGQLLEREKMAAIGSLSAGLLQDLNNPVKASLTAIDLGLTMAAVKGDKMLTETLQDAREGMDRVHSIVSDLRIFAQPLSPPEAPEPFVLEQAMRSAIRLASFDLKGVPVSVDLPTDTVVKGDEPALIGVMINLLSNAAHAVKSIKRAHPGVQLRGEKLGDRVRITVRDNGPGIEKDVIGRVFDPFFTTRGIGSGLGLGLSISQAIVQRHDSRLIVQSEPGAWTEFSFDLALH